MRGADRAPPRRLPQLTASGGGPPEGEEDYLSLLPSHLPRFGRGDRPLAGIDWELEELLGAGGFGDGSWTRDSNQWVIRTNSVLQDGKKATATYILTHVDADTISVQARDRSVDGKAIPDTPAVKLKRMK